MRVVPNFLRPLVLTLVALVTGLGMTFAQTSTKETRGTMSLIEGRRYFVAFPKVWASPSEKPMNPSMMLFVSSKSKTTITIKTPAGINQAPRIDRSYDLEPNKILQIPISTAYMNVESEAREGFGIWIEGKKPVSVSTYQAWQGNGELARHLPTEAWGKNYFTMNFYQDRYGANQGYKYRPSQILVIAEKDNTVVNYTPTFDTEGGRDVPTVRKGQTGQVTLERGETFLIMAKIDEAQNKEFTTDLSGTFIRATKNVGIVSGHTKVAIMRYPDVLPPTGAFAAEAHFVRNNVHDCMLPLEMAGTKFVTLPCMYTPTRVTGQASIEFGIDDDRGDVIRVVALEDNTTIKAMRSNGQGLLNMWKINRGETRLATAVEIATYWESDKPILMGQYGKSYAKILPPAMGKDGEGTQGHPTVESGMPMLEYIPSTDRWVTYGTFKSPEGMDNFFNIAFKPEEIGKIKVDGRALNSAFGGSMRMLPGTPYAYIRTPISPGDHVVESEVETAKWVAWTYGSLDGLQQGRAYGTPVSIDLAIPCPDSLAVTETIVCGDVTGVGQILPEGIACGSIFAVYAEDLTNYELVVDEAFSSGDQKVNFWVNVTDKTKDADAVIRVVTRSGKFIDKEYHYVADKISWTPPSVNFGTIPFNTPVTKEFTIKNENPTRPVNVNDLRAKYFPNVYTFNPKQFTIPAGGTQVVSVTAIIQDAREKLDTVIAVLDCFEKQTAELIVRGEEPVIYVGDQTWVNVPVSAGGQVKDVVIQNGSDVDLIITSFEPGKLPVTSNGTTEHFYNPQNLIEKLPLTLRAGEKHTFQVTYNPWGDITSPQHREDVKFFSNATRVDDIAVLIGNGVNINLAATAEPWNVRVLDNVQTSQSINEYPQVVEFSNFGTQPETFNQPFIRGADAASFKIVNTGNTGGFPIQLIGGGANETRNITVAFVPTELPGRAGERNNYDAELVFPTNSAETPEVAVALKGVAWQPQVKGADYNFGSFQTGAPVATAQISITNDHYMDVSNPTSGDTKGTHSVIVTGIRWSDVNDPDNARFTILNPPTPANPWRINIGAGDEEVMRVSFDPSVSGTFEAKYDIITQPTDMTDGAAAYTPTYTLTAVVAGGEFTVTNASAVQYVWHPKDMFITIKHDENTTKRFNIGDPQGADASRFTVLDPPTGYIDVPPGPTGAVVRVQFVPDYVTVMQNGQTQQWLTSKGNPNGIVWRGTGSFSTDITFTDASNTEKTQTSHLTGDGIYIETTNLVASDYKVDIGNTAKVAIQLAADPESLNQPQINELRVRVSYDPKLIRPTVFKDPVTGLPKPQVELAGSQMENWKIVSFTQVTDGMFEVDFGFDPNKASTPLTNDDTRPAFYVNFDAFNAYSSDPGALFESPVSVYTYPVDLDQSGDDKRYCVFRDVPGKVTVNGNCARQMRIVAIGSVRYGVQPVSPNPVSSSAVINYSIGINAHTSIVLYNSTGLRVLDLVDQDLASGSYELTVDVSSLPAGVYFYQVVSGPYTSEMQTINVVK